MYLHLLKTSSVVYQYIRAIRTYVVYMHIYVNKSIHFTHMLWLVIYIYIPPKIYTNIIRVQGCGLLLYTIQILVV